MDDRFTVRGIVREPIERSLTNGSRFELGSEAGEENIEIIGRDGRGIVDVERSRVVPETRVVSKNRFGEMNRFSKVFRYRVRYFVVGLDEISSELQLNPSLDFEKLRFDLVERVVPDLFVDR